ncbi:hypothetical protein E1301_Tti000880 [Triplophysa tibetana]|uniref:Uncharacterized protein n=1 Tax=Triplophysa tibetana TaxID=1572043 RepID=A0A5A9N6K9_9TELE|nr:hypothetical protein E1301_Tti000880 [Triplophysa tibetana]
MEDRWSSCLGPFDSVLHPPTAALPGHRCPFIKTDCASPALMTSERLQSAFKNPPSGKSAFWRNDGKECDLNLILGLSLNADWRVIEP